MLVYQEIYKQVKDLNGTQAKTPAQGIIKAGEGTIRARQDF